MIERYSPWLVLVLLLLAYGNALNTPFQFDDYNVIVAAQSAHSFAAWWHDLGHGLRPLLKLSYVMNWVSGLDVWGFHLFNLLVHLANTLLVYKLVLRVCELSGKSAIAWAIGMLSAALFALHPVHTEAVTYISGRSISLMTMFYLASVQFYAQGREQQKSWLVYIASPVLFVLAVASKETAVTLPFALLLWERCFYVNSPWRELGEKLAVHGTLLLAMVMVLLMQERYWQMMDFSANLHSVMENLYTQIHAMTYLLGQLLIPLQQNIDPDLAVVKSWQAVWPEALLWVALLAVAFTQRSRLMRFALLWMLLQLFPIYVFLPRLDIANDRQLYLADWAVLMLIALFITMVFKQDKTRYVFVLILLFSASVATWSRNQDYRSEIALWEATVLASPHKARPQNNLGYAYFLDGRISDAERAYSAALKIDPNFWRAENNLLQLRENRQ